MSCSNKILSGLGIGAGAGLGLLLFVPDGLQREAVIRVPLLFGGVGSLVGYKMCR